MRAITLLTCLILSLGWACNEVCEQDHESWPAFESGKVCEIHGIKLLPDVVPLYFGYYVYERDYLEAMIHKFPHAKEEFFCGCGDPGLTTARIGYCIECRKAQGKWLASRPHNKEKTRIP
ncbi:MAG TPA: hypothetical protein PLN21_13830 [Gemmatales bacterium]|nr:hypothetical protein [Gemmatales bacterium]